MTVLSTFVREQADWRQSKANEHPEDRRNQRSADSLRALADYVDADPEMLVDYPELGDRHGTGRYLAGEEAARMIARFGFDYPPCNFYAFVAALADAEDDAGSSDALYSASSEDMMADAIYAECTSEDDAA